MLFWWLRDIHQHRACHAQSHNTMWPNTAPATQSQTATGFPSCPSLPLHESGSVSFCYSFYLWPFGSVTLSFCYCSCLSLFSSLSSCNSFFLLLSLSLTLFFLSLFRSLSSCNSFFLLLFLSVTVSLCSFFFVIVMMLKSPQHGCFPAKLPLTMN